MKKKWKDIPEYKNLYKISNYGEIKSLKRNKKNNNGKQAIKEKILKTSFNNKGYEQIVLCKNSKLKCFRIHRLVAITFIKNKFNKPYVCHKDNNIKNNIVNNLYWGTQSENIIQAYKDNRCNKTLIKAKENIKKIHILTSKKVYKYDKNKKYITSYISSSEAARKNKMAQSVISVHCNNNTISRNGFYWSY